MKKRKKRAKDLLNILEQKRRSLAKKLDIGEESGFDETLDAILESENFKRWMPGKEAPSEMRPEEKDTASEMMDDLISFGGMVERLELILTMVSTGKMCPLHGMREAGRMVDQVSSTMEKWYKYSEPDA